MIQHWDTIGQPVYSYALPWKLNRCSTWGYYRSTNASFPVLHHKYSYNIPDIPWGIIDQSTLYCEYWIRTDETFINRVLVFGCWPNLGRLVNALLLFDQRWRNIHTPILGILNLIQPWRCDWLVNISMSGLN